MNLGQVTAVSAPDAPTTQDPAAFPRFTLCGDAVAEARVAQDLSRLATGIDSEMGDALRALVLVGPFARGEGGIVGLPGEPSPATPGYELLAIVARGARRHETALLAMAASWTRLLRSEVRIRPISGGSLAHRPASRFWYHVGRGQTRTLTGDPTAIAAAPAWASRALRWDEADLLTCEALSTLAIAELEARPDTTSTLAAMMGAVIATCDTLLLRRGEYAETLAARGDALSRAQAPAALRAAHQDAIRWLARPDAWRPAAGSLDDWLDASRRLLRESFVGRDSKGLHTTQELLAFATAPRPWHRDPNARHAGRLARAAASISLPHADLAAYVAQPRERLLRCSVVLGLAPHAQACRAVAAKLLRVAPDPLALAQALRRLATTALPDALD